MSSRFVRSLRTALVAATMLATLASPAFADPRDFDLENASSVTITHAYVSPSSVLSWEEDVLGREVLFPGETATIHFENFDGETCLYDIKVVGAEEQEGYLTQIDLCTVYTVSFTD